MKKKHNKKFYYYIGIATLAFIATLFVLYSSMPKSTALPNNCGDLSNSANIQHLSHHPSIYGECIKLVDAQKFYAAVGVSKEEYMTRNGMG